MTAAIMRKALGCLRPVDDAGDALLSKIGLGKDVLVEVKRPRNPGQHRKLFAMLNIVLSNQEHYASVDQLLSVCKLRTGYCDVIQTKLGEVSLPKSISYASMSQSDFEVFYDKAVEWVVEEVIPGLQKGELNDEVEKTLLAFGG